MLSQSVQKIKSEKEKEEDSNDIFNIIGNGR